MPDAGVRDEYAGLAGLRDLVSLRGTAATADSSHTPERSTYVNTTVSGPDYAREVVLVSYQWIPQGEVSGHQVPVHALGRAAMELEGRAWREHQHRVDWGEGRLLDGVSHDVPGLAALPEQERETALHLLHKQQRWPWMRSRMRLVRCWVTSYPEQPAASGS